jgi:hypothetical protein
VKKFNVKQRASIHRDRFKANTHVGSHDLKHAAVDVLVRDAFDVPVSNLLVPDLQWLGAVRAVRMLNTGLMTAMRGGSSPDAIQN